MRKAKPLSVFRYEDSDTYVETTDKKLALTIYEYAKKHANDRYTDLIAELKEELDGK